MGHNIPEVQAWIKKIIDSCKNDCHFDGAQIVIDQFKDRCNEDAQWVETQHYLHLKYTQAYAVFLNDEVISFDELKQCSFY
jgi:hypothetical protein